MSYLLDTDTIIHLFRGSRSVAERAHQVGEGRLLTTTINLAELYFGAFNSQKVDDNVATVDEFRRTVRVLSFDHRAAVLFGRIKATLRRDGAIVSDSDLFIAASALATRSVLVTKNVRHFARVEGLTWENWVQ